MSSKLVFKDISKEEDQRSYLFPNSGHPSDITIEWPTEIHISESGGHRIVDSKRNGHYIPPKWISCEVHIADGGLKYMDFNFDDISCEAIRTYTFAFEDNSIAIDIIEPQGLYVDSNGFHYILSNDESMITIIRPEWIHLSWIPKDDQPTFVV